MKIRHLLTVGLLWFAFALWPNPAAAAKLFLQPSAVELRVGQTLDLELRVNSESQGFNAVQATIQFPKDIFEVKSLDFSPAASVFNFWLEGPGYSNDSGRIAFTGGTTDGVVGASVQILKFTLAAKGVGDAEVVISDAAVTASDGSGTNILSTLGSGRFVVKPDTVKPAAPPSAAEQPPATPLPISTPPFEPIPPPTQIKATPTVAKKLPAKPAISVPLYPEEVQWYNTIANFLVQWDLPGDISDISTAVNKNSVFTPPAGSEGLFNAKVFPALEDGIWYLHVRFKNNVGWGPVAHYRLSIDSQPPPAFSVSVDEGLSTDHPAPTLHFSAGDGLSGLKGYSVRIDDGELLAAESGAFKLPLQPPGRHAVLVQAADNAGNIRESLVEIEILPIESPIIAYVNGNAYVGEGDLVVSGAALPNLRVLLSVKDGKGLVVAEARAKADETGAWQALFKEPLKKGSYVVEAVTQDDRGALSLPARSGTVNVRERPMLTIDGLAITEFWFFVGLLVLFAGVFAIGWLSDRFWRKQAGRKAVIAQRDVVNAFASVEKDINTALNNYVDKLVDERESEEIETLLKKMKTDLKKTQKYIIENIKEIGE